MQYTAKIFKDGDFYSVTFPDVPGANTFASTVEEARTMAKDALDGVLFSMLERKDPLPVANASLIPDTPLIVAPVGKSGPLI